MESIHDRSFKIIDANWNSVDCIKRSIIIEEKWDQFLFRYANSSNHSYEHLCDASLWDWSLSWKRTIACWQTDCPNQNVDKTCSYTYPRTFDAEVLIGSLLPQDLRNGVWSRIKDDKKLSAWYVLVAKSPVSFGLVISAICCISWFLHSSMCILRFLLQLRNSVMRTVQVSSSLLY